MLSLLLVRRPPLPPLSLLLLRASCCSLLFRCGAHCWLVEAYLPASPAAAEGASLLDSSPVAALSFLLSHARSMRSTPAPLLYETESNQLSTSDNFLMGRLMDRGCEASDPSSSRPAGTAVAQGVTTISALDSHRGLHRQVGQVLPF
jgi:hypothetical protein